MKQKVTADYTFKGKCDSCNQKPVLKDLGMCSVCTFGEASSLWEWLDDGVVTTEHDAARRFLDKQLFEWGKENFIDNKGNFNPIAARVLHLNQHVLDRIESII